MIPSEIRRGMWVVQTRGQEGRGRIGLVVEVGSEWGLLVQFGAGGPMQRLKPGSLREATAEEIADREGTKVRQGRRRASG